MTVEPGHEPTEWESASRPKTESPPPVQAVHYSTARHGSHVEESPELLRWRADLLMDEMMMGGVDVSAADGNRTFSGIDSPVVPRPSVPHHSGPTHSDNGRSPRDSYAREGYVPKSPDRRGDEDLRPAANHPAPGHPPPNYTNGLHSSSGPNGSYNPADEMGAGYHSAPTPRSQPDTPAEPERRAGPYYTNQRPNELDHAPYDVAAGRERGRVDSEGLSSRSYEEPLRPPPVRPEPPDAQPTTYGQETALPSAPRVGGDDAPVSGEQATRNDRLYSLEQQYEQFRREQSANVQPTRPAPPVTSRPPLPPVEPPPQPTATPRGAPRVTPQPPDEHTQWATGPDKWEYQDFSATPGEEEEASFLGGYSTPDRRLVEEGAVRHDPAQFVSAMSVIGSNKKRSTLLPRMSTLDVDTLHREISDLHGEIAALLPVGNETGERARHLLDKAYSILQSDPMRSAEVEYYMQQVRTIVQRLHQARQWSDLYRHRLHIYLWGWLGLSAVVVIARFLFQTGMEESFMWMFGLGRDSLLVSHWATFIGTAFAGALGGAMGALYTMQAHARGEYSFFDRKYGLRGLILPFMGLSVGALGYLLFGLVFALVGIDPSQSLTAAVVPTMAAFAFGFSQESIYGTRG